MPIGRVVRSADFERLLGTHRAASAVAHFAVHHLSAPPADAAARPAAARVVNKPGPRIGRCLWMSQRRAHPPADADRPALRVGVLVPEAPRAPLGDAFAAEARDARRRGTPRASARARLVAGAFARAFRSGVVPERRIERRCARRRAPSSTSFARRLHDGVAAFREGTHVHVLAEHEAAWPRAHAARAPADPGIAGLPAAAQPVARHAMPLRADVLAVCDRRARTTRRRGAAAIWRRGACCAAIRGATAGVDPVPEQPPRLWPRGLQRDAMALSPPQATLRVPTDASSPKIAP